MASIKTESAGSWADFIWNVCLIFGSVSLPMHLMMLLGLDQYEIPQWIGIPAFGIVAVVTYGLLKGLLTAFFALVSLATELVEALASRVADFAEWLLTTLVELAAVWGLKLLALPFLPLIFGLAWLYRTFIATIAERRRQREELRRLYEEVKDEYDSFEDFVRDFESVGEQSRQREKDKQDEQRRQREQSARPSPSCDPFKEACVLFGLPVDGSFTQAEFKQRYTAMMKAVHPDLIGQNGLAAQVNEARNIIRQRKGWQ